MTDPSEWRDYGNISASDAQHGIGMSCDKCRVTWIGCADVFQCPVCGEGDPPWLCDPMGLLE